MSRRRAIRPLVGRVITGDCLKQLRRLPTNSVNLIVTSPPYAENRKGTYEGVPVAEYGAWFLPRAAEMLRVLKRDGSLVLNIKERVIDGERGTYVLELIAGMREQGWRWVEEYIWHKKNCYPGKWPNRFRDGWERCLHFTKERQFKMRQEAVMVPTGDWAAQRLRRLGPNDEIRWESTVRSGFGKRVRNWVGRDLAYPTNVLHMATECANRNHSAAFPEQLPTWFIKLLSDQGDIVLDPFAGSGTTGLAAVRLGRRFVGIELKAEYSRGAREALRRGLNGGRKAQRIARSAIRS